jgi:hypothetical protein
MQEWNSLRTERDALKAEVARLATGNLAAQHRAAVENTRLREALEVVLPLFCEHLCSTLAVQVSIKGPAAQHVSECVKGRAALRPAGGDNQEGK